MTKGTALVTGASSGIGATYAEHLARRGFDLILVARDKDRLERLAGTIRGETGVTVEVLPADLTDDEAIASVERRLAADEAITLLVNNAGIDIAGSLTTTPRDLLKRLVGINVTAVMLLAAAAGRAFAERGRGGIINLSSVLALAPELMDGTYSGTKAFVLNLSQGLAREIGDKGVQVQAVLPGATRTEIWSRAEKDVSGLPDEWIMDVDDLVSAALVGFDHGELVTIPPLADDGDWQAMQEARTALLPQLSRRDVAPRYRTNTQASGART